MLYRRKHLWSILALLSFTACDGSSAGPCDGILCSGHGRCVVESQVAFCACDPGFEPEGLMCVDPTDPAPTTLQIVQHGVAFTFAEPVRFGRFANGDYWVLGPVTVVRVSPDFTGRFTRWTPCPTMAPTSPPGTPRGRSV